MQPSNVLVFTFVVFFVLQLYTTRWDMISAQQQIEELRLLLTKVDNQLEEMLIRLEGENQRKNKNPSGLEMSLGALAKVREFVHNYHNYETFDIPREVRRWYTYTAKEVEYLDTLEQDDAILIEYIQRQILIPPAPSNVSYNLKDPKIADGSQGQTSRILEIFKNMENGTFIECGALDGESISNTLTLERDFGWSGLLIEADPFNFQIMLTKNRKSWLVPACLSLEKKTKMVTFDTKIFGLGQILREIKDPQGRQLGSKLLDIHCLPLTSILLALNKTQIDYFSLDIEGNELQVLKTIDFERIDIKVLSVEFSHGAEPKETMKKFMEQNGYRVFPSEDEWAQENYIFIKENCGL